jgi:hypothetical protein
MPVPLGLPAAEERIKNSLLRVSFQSLHSQPNWNTLT